MTIKVQVAGAWVTIATGKFRVRNPSTSTDWLYPAKVRICWNDGAGGTNRWIDTGYVGIPGAPTAFKNVAWDYDSMQVTWAAPAGAVPISGYRVTVVQNTPAGATRNFDTTALTYTFSVAMDTKYTVTVTAKGDTGVLGPASAAIRPAIGHSELSTTSTVTKWKAWESDLKYFTSGPPDTAIYRNQIQGIYINSGYKADHLYVTLTGKYPWTPPDGYLINNSDRTAEYIVASAHYNNIAPRNLTTWTEMIAMNQTTPGAFGIRLTGSGWSAAGGGLATYTVVSGDSWYGIAGKLGCTVTELLEANPPATLSTVIHPGDKLNVPGVGVALTGAMKAYGQQSYLDTVKTVTRTEVKNALW